MSQEPYEVGKGRPPKASQWKKGQSGNPSGKKKADVHVAQPMLECLAQQLLTLVDTSQNGKLSKMPFANLMITKLLHDFMAAPFGQKLKAMMIFKELGVLDIHQMLLEEQALENGGDVLYLNEELRRVLKILEVDMPVEDKSRGGRDS